MDNDELNLFNEVKNAINKAIDERPGAVSNVVVLVGSAGQRAELQSSNQDIDTLISKAHESLNKLKGGNGGKGTPGYAG